MTIASGPPVTAHNLRFFSFWAINDRLDQAELRRQLDEMKRLGLQGAVWHPRFYPNDPPYLSDAYFAQVSDAILYAKSLGLAFWIYDENGWPSGTVGGELLRQHPDVAQQWAELVIEAPVDPADQLGSFERDGRRWFVARRRGAGVDYLNPDLARHFLAMTYDRYRDGLTPEAFAHVEAFFSDEPEFGLGHAYDALSPHGAIPWTPRLPELFRARYGQDFAIVLPLMFFPGDGHRDARVRFWELLTDLFCESFVAPLDAWCRDHGKRFTAHVKGEEHPLFQVPITGSAQRVFRHLSLPAIDALERFPSGDFFPRQVASVAQQFGDGRCMAECFGGAGWGARPEDLERYLLWLAGHGVTDFVFHLWQYKLTSHAIRDWPASIPVHVNWRHVFPDVLRRVRSRLAADPVRPADTLVISPHRGIMAEYEPRELRGMNIHNAATYGDSPAGRINTAFLEVVAAVHAAGAAYHFADERTFEEGEVNANGDVRIGRRRYERLVVAEGCVFSRRGEEMVRAAREANGRDFAPAIPTAETENVIRSITPQWAVGGRCVNEFVLEPQDNGSGAWTSVFESDDRCDVEVCFADAVAEVQLNDGSDRVVVRAGRNELRFRTRPEVETPFVWLRGSFRVRSEASIEEGPNGTLRTAGPLLLARASGAFCSEFVEGGYPFARELPVLESHIELPMTAESVVLAGVEADAARVWIDGIDLGFAYGPAWRIDLPDDIAGSHVLAVQLIPSTYNFYGPHHHVDGDRHVVSPDQFTGRKNFADRADAPNPTSVPAWHFKPVRPPTGIQIIA